MTTQYPPTFAEQNLSGDVHIRPEDIASYAYPEGERPRYTETGWQKAINLCIAILHDAEVPVHLQWHDIGCIKRYGAESDQLCECEKRRQDQPEHGRT